MKLFDFNIHLPCGENNLDSRLQDEISMSGSSLEKCFSTHRNNFEKHCVGGNIMLLNASLDDTEIESLVNKIKSSWPNSCLTVMIDPRDKSWGKRVEILHDLGVSGIKFHCYIQKIANDDIPTCVEISKKAQSLGMLIMIDASYGSLGMYQFDNLRLATAIATVVTRTSIILLHSGGARCLEAMLLADSTKNIFLETSFSLSYYLGSSVERDLAFVYKKLGEDKILYGSDFPYVSFDKSEEIFFKFMDKWNFTSKQIDKITIQNALGITNLRA